MRFVIPAKFFSLLIAIAFFTSLSGAEKDTLSITTVSGKHYENAVVERVGVAGIDISYINNEGVFCLAGILFTDLPVEIQQKYNYNPEAARKYQQKVAVYQKSTAEKKIDTERQRLEKTAAALRADFKAGREINDKDLALVIQGFRRLVEVEAVANTRSGGTLVKVTGEQQGEGMPPLEQYIIIDGVKLQPGVGGWSGFVYPTGLKAKAQGRNNVPVYCDSQEDALKLINRYFEIYGAFAASGSSAGKADVPDQTAAENTANAPAADSGIVVNYYEDDDDGYYMGATYWPVWWWNNHRPPRPPRPHHPPKPVPRPPCKPDQRPSAIGRPAGISGRPAAGKKPVKSSAVGKVVKTPRPGIKVNSAGQPVKIERCGNFSRVQSHAPAVRSGFRGGRR